MDAEFSRWRGGATSFGPITKLILTSAAIAATVASVAAGIAVSGSPLRFMLITRTGLLLVLIPAGSIALVWWLWKPRRVR
jgi:hypothetical protein